MIENEPRLRGATEEDLDAIVSLLSSYDLPTVDLSGVVSSLFVLDSDGAIIGSGGVEVYGETGLLRSVAVRDSLKGAGFGTVICREIFDRMRAQGLTELYLLTTTAPGFFERMGFTRIDRNDVPADIQGTTEFSTLCPQSAVCMLMSL